jgi:peptide/nickel transport system permease protein
VLLSYIGKRLLQMIPLLLCVTIIIFIVIQLPPGDYLTTYIRQRESTGTIVGAEEIAALKARYGLDQPLYLQYFDWIWGIISRGDFGSSFSWDMPVAKLIGQRLPLTLAVSILTLIFVWGVSIPIGIYSATHQYSIGDYIVSAFGFIGMSVPGFLLALFVIYQVYRFSGVAISGMFSYEYQMAAWSWAKVMNMLPRFLVLVGVIGVANTAGMIRTFRAMMLDELGKQYVTTARAKGVSERRLLWKYPVRMAITPQVSTLAATFAGLISGETIVSLVFNMETTGPMMYQALITQDMYLAGSFLLISSVMVVVGSLISDILLALIDPRIRFGGVVE